MMVYTPRMAQHMGFVTTVQQRQYIKRMAKARGLRISQWFRVIVEAEWARYNASLQAPPERSVYERD